MFNKFSDLLGGKKQGYKPGSLLPILSASVVLADRRYQHYYELLKPLAAIPEEHFEHFYLGTIHRFAEYVQVMPKAFDQPLGGLLLEGLLVSINTLALFVQHYPQSSALERFALYTACLLQDISCIASRFNVLITNQEGVTQRVWHPYTSPLTEQSWGSHYKLLPISSTFERLDKGVRSLLARQVVGESGFAWLTSDLYVLLEWLAALQDEEGEEVMRLIKVMKLYRQRLGGLLDGLPLIDIEALESPATEYADLFLTWLAEGISNGSIKTNRADAEVHFTEAGVFIEKSAILKTFAEKFKLPGAVVFTQLGNLLGVGRQGGGDLQYAQLFSDYPDQNAGAQRSFAGPLGRKAGMMRDGILLNNATVIALRGTSPAASPYIRLPTDIKTTPQALADFRQDPQAPSMIKKR